MCGCGCVRAGANLTVDVCVTNNSKQCSENWLECVCEKWFRLLFTSNYWHDICIVVNASIVRMTFNFCYVYAYAVARAHNTVLYIYMLLMLVTEEINTRNLFERHNYAHSLKCYADVAHAGRVLMVLVLGLVVVSFLSLINDMNIYFMRIALYLSAAQFMCCAIVCVFARHGMSCHQSAGSVHSVTLNRKTK